MRRRVTVAFFGALPLLAQTPAFDVASVVRSKQVTAVARAEIVSMNSRGVYARAGLASFIAKAYDIPAVFVSGGPVWMDSQLFIVKARTGVPADEAQVKLMLQALLADRFKLKIHREMKIRPVSSLTLGKSPPRLTPALDREVTRVGVRPEAIEGHKVSMAYLAEYLTRQTGELVVDNTGLKGDFDFSINLARGSQEAENDPLFLPWKLGLSVETRKWPVETMVIDHAEMPPGN